MADTIFRSKVKDECLKYHHAFVDAGIINGRNFYPKPVIKNKAGEKCITLYEQELTNSTERYKNGFYTELCDTEYKVLSPRRILRWKGSSLDIDNYDTKTFDDGQVKYYVPIDELEIVNITSDLLRGDTSIDNVKEIIRSREENEDAPFSTMTIRDYFAIKHFQPVSNKKWLNDLILNRKQFTK
jgi:hypothetical protein